MAKAPQAIIGPVLALAVAFAAAAPGARADEAKPSEQAPRSVTELRLPEYQAEVMAADLPARDVLLEDGGAVLWTIGKTSLWRWDLAAQKLKRWPLHDKPADRSTLQRLGSDGLSVFAASGGTLYQLQLAPGRLFRYGIPVAGPRGRTLAFAGAGDALWLVHSNGVVQFDRYGKRLETRRAFGALEPKDHVALDPTRKRLWVARAQELLKVDMGGDESAPQPKPVVVLKARHRLVDVQLGSADLVVHTPYTVLRLDPDTGKVRQSIPVEGRRKLQRMSIGAAAHAYLFDDRLLEVFQVAQRTAYRFRLPLDDDEQVGRMTLAAGRMALLIDGRPRVFGLNGLK